MLQFKRLSLALFCAFVSFASGAANLSVDKLFVVADESQNGVVTVYNTGGEAIFVNSAVEEFVVADDGLSFVKTPYTKENVADWKISTTLSKMVLQGKEAKNIGIRSLCYNTSCDNSRDQMFFITFMPTPYAPDADADANKVQLNYGFSPVYIIPTDSPSFDYTIKYHGQTLEVDNKSNSLIYVSVDACADDKAGSCISKQTLVAGRTKTFKLTPNALGKELSITVTSHGNSLLKKYKIKPNSQIKS